MRLPLRSLLLPALLSALLPWSVRASDEEARKIGVTLFQNVCATCHGPAGQGSEPLKVPSIAGKPAWYVLRQLDNFREGRRGTSVTEPQAMVMAAMVKAIAPANLESVAAHIETLAPVPPPAPMLLKGASVAMGKELFEERCMECHRYNGSGEMTFGSPPLWGLADWYILAQIRKFKNGQRGAVPGDQYGAKMVFSSQFIESDEALNSVVAYILTLNPELKAADTVEVLFQAPAAKSAAAQSLTH